MRTVRGQFHLLHQLCDLCVNTMESILIHTMESITPDKYFDLKTSKFIFKKKIKPVGGTFASRQETLKEAEYFTEVQITCLDAYKPS